MRIFLSILIFYKKLVVPSLVMSLVFGFLVYTRTNHFSWTTVALSYMLMTLVFHYFIYEKRNPGEYYVYFNMGISKLMLWASTFCLSSIFIILSVLICVICI